MIIISYIWFILWRSYPSSFQKFAFSKFYIYVLLQVAKTCLALITPQLLYKVDKLQSLLQNALFFSLPFLGLLVKKKVLFHTCKFTCDSLSTDILKCSQVCLNGFLQTNLIVGLDDEQSIDLFINTMVRFKIAYMVCIFLGHINYRAHLDS